MYGDRECILAFNLMKKCDDNNIQWLMMTATTMMMMFVFKNILNIPSGKFDQT